MHAEASACTHAPGVPLARPPCGPCMQAGLTLEVAPRPAVAPRSVANGCGLSMSMPSSPLSWPGDPLLGIAAARPRSKGSRATRPPRGGPCIILRRQVRSVWNCGSQLDAAIRVEGPIRSCVLVTRRDRLRAEVCRHMGNTVHGQLKTAACTLTRHACSMRPQALPFQAAFIPHSKDTFRTTPCLPQKPGLVEQRALRRRKIPRGYQHALQILGGATRLLIVQIWSSQRQGLCAGVTLTLTGGLSGGCVSAERFVLTDADGWGVA